MRLIDRAVVRIASIAVNRVPEAIIWTRWKPLDHDGVGGAIAYLRGIIPDGSDTAEATVRFGDDGTRWRVIIEQIKEQGQ